jgi:CHAT domain-containing protein
MRLLVISLSICLLSYLSSAFVYATSMLKNAQMAFDKGQFEEAIFLWHEELYKQNQLSAKTVFDIKIKLASAYQKIGSYQNAFDLLLGSLSQTSQRDFAHQAEILSAIAELYLSGYEDKKSIETKNMNLTVTLKYCFKETTMKLSIYQKVGDCLKQAMLLANKTTDKLLKAKLLNKQGNYLLRKAYYEEAINKYEDSEKLAIEVGDFALVSKTWINKVHAMSIKDEVEKTVVENFNNALKVTQQLEASHDKSFGLMALSNMISKKPKPFISKSGLRWFQHTALTLALESANKIQDKVAKSYAYGYLGKLYEDEKRYQEALLLTYQAVFFAQEKALPELLYLWYWQQGRIFKALGQKEEAIKSYQFARKSIQKENMKDCNHSIIPRLLQTGYRDRVGEKFHDKVGQLYFELADLLLNKLRPNLSQKEKNEKLMEILEVVEDFKIVEFQHYFRDDCIIEKIALKEFKVPAKTAVIYPILLPKRIEILVKLPSNDIEKFTVFPQKKKNEKVDLIVTKKASVFNAQLRLNNQTNSHEYQENARQFHNWLIEPIEKTLTQHDIKTLLVVPDRELRLIPFAALHDGKKFLIQKYAIATLSSLKLTDSTAINESKTLSSSQSVQIFIGGLSESVKRPDNKLSAPLHSVQTEVREIQNLYPKNSKTFLNEALTKSIFKAEMENPPPYTMIHIASHTYFSLNPDKSYLLFYDEHLTIENLESLLKAWEIKNQPVQLLSLSACETARGDDYKAILGLAGVSIKAGVETTLGNLWMVKDKAAAELSIAFYKHLKKENVTRAQALQKAQQELLQNKDFEHPSAWAALILIGNWL